MLNSYTKLLKFILCPFYKWSDRLQVNLSVGSPNLFLQTGIFKISVFVAFFSRKIIGYFWWQLHKSLVTTTVLLLEGACLGIWVVGVWGFFPFQWEAVLGLNQSAPIQPCSHLVLLQRYMPGKKGGLVVLSFCAAVVWGMGDLTTSNRYLSPVPIG